MRYIRSPAWDTIRSPAWNTSGLKLYRFPWLFLDWYCHLNLFCLIRQATFDFSRCKFVDSVRNIKTLRVPSPQGAHVHVFQWQTWACILAFVQYACCHAGGSRWSGEEPYYGKDIPWVGEITILFLSLFLSLSAENPEVGEFGDCMTKVGKDNDSSCNPFAACIVDVTVCFHRDS